MYLYKGCQYIQISDGYGLYQFILLIKGYSFDNLSSRALI